MIELFFVFIIGIIFYCYAGYPVILWVMARLFGRSVYKDKCYLPAVSVIVSVYNEEDVILRRLNNLLYLDYPSDKIEILVASDGSTDRTNEIIRSFSDSRLRFKENASRSGKMAVLNDLVSQANNDIIVFADARQVFAATAIRELVANFADPDVGCVSGELVFLDEGGPTARGVGLYWRYEKFIRKQESALSSMLGATGAIYAIRKALFHPIPENIILDDVFVPLKIIQKGYRAIFDVSAKAFDRAADNPKEEFIRKVRTLAGNYQILCMEPCMLNPFKSPIAIQLFSHKFLRLVVPFMMVIAFLLNLFLAMDNLFFRWILLMQIVFYGLAVIGLLLKDKKTGILSLVARFCYIPYVFCLLNFSAVVGLLRFILKTEHVKWEKARVGR